MTADEVLAELSTLGSETTKKTFMRHGAREPFFGVKIQDLKKIQKRVKKDQALALALYETGNTDAMYLAGMICDPPRMKKTDLQRWVKKAYWSMLCEYTVPWVASESPYGAELALEWIDAKRSEIASAGWSTYSSLVAIKPDEQLDFAQINTLLDRVASDIHKADNRVRYTMNGFVIAVGCSVRALAARAKEVAKEVGVVEVDMGGTACKVPPALAYIEKVEESGRQGRKRKTAFC